MLTLTGICQKNFKLIIKNQDAYIYIQLIIPNLEINQPIHI